jgi:hypothetical protein
MRMSQRLCFAAVFVVTGLAAWAEVTTLYAQPAGAQGPTGPMTPSLARAQGFLYFAYPELVGRQVTFAFNQVGSTIAATVSEPRNPLLEPTTPRVEPLIGATLEFAADGRLLAFAATGTVVSSALNRQVRETLLVEAPWTDEHAAVRLMRAGATAGPDEGAGIAGRIAAEPWQTFLGSAVAVGTPVFKFRDEGAPGPDGPIRGALSWVVPVTAGEQTARASYQLEFEPFGGRLVAVVSK